MEKKKKDKYRVKREDMNGEPAVGMEVREILQGVQEERRAVQKRKEKILGEQCVESPEAENWWSEELNVLKDLHVGGLLSKEEKDLAYDGKGRAGGGVRRSWILRTMEMTSGCFDYGEGK